MKKFNFLILLLCMTWHISYAQIDNFIQRPPFTITTDNVFTNCSEGNLVSHRNMWYTFTETLTGFTNRGYTIDSVSTLRNGKYYNELLVSLSSLTGWDGTDKHLREEGKKVYQSTNDGEVLLYDFTLEVDDVFYASEKLLYSWGFELIVVAVDSVTLLDNSKRKRLRLLCKDFPTDELHWIEGIGSHKGVLGVGDGCSFDANTFLTSFNCNGNNLYDSHILLINNKLERHGIKIFPNPVKDHIKISGLNKFIEYQLYSANGISLFSGTTADQIDIQDLPAGLYLLELEVEGQKVMSKIVKE